MDIVIDRYIIFAVLAVIMSLSRHGTYLWSIYKKQTQPHVFTWVNWALLIGIGAFAQFEFDGGPSAWVLVITAASCAFIAFISLFVGTKDITRSDWFAFIAGLIAIVLWRLTDNPIIAVVIVIFIDICCYYPTARKSWHAPWTEPPVSYIWAGSRYFFGMFAVPDPTFSSLIFLFYCMCTDWGFAAYIWWRRYVLRKRLAVTG